MYSLLDTKTRKDEAQKLAKDWREEGFSVRITKVKGGYYVWKSVMRKEEVVSERRKKYRSSKRGK